MKKQLLEAILFKPVGRMDVKDTQLIIKFKLQKMSGIVNGKLILIFIVSLYLFVLTTCNIKNASTIRLMQVKLADIDEIDTLESYLNDSIMIVNLVNNQSLGRYTVTLGVVLKMNNCVTVYKAQDFYPFIISHNYIAKQKEEFYGKKTWGWFNVENARLSNQLPKETDFKKLLEKRYPKPDFFVNSNSTGEYFVYTKGILVEKFNYGNFMLNDNSINFDSIDSKVFELIDGKIFERGNLSPDEVISVKNGLFFVSKPGVGVSMKINKTGAVIKLDSIRRLKNPPIFFDLN